MKKKFRVEGVDCPNCATKIEKLVAKIEGVTSSKINFMAEKLTVEADESVCATLLEEVTKAARVVEPDVVVEEI